jgi:prepilin-type processing-associated H-X9-DG protein
MDKPSQNIWLADTAINNKQIAYFDGGFNYPQPHCLSVLRLIQIRHLKTANCWFLDGHLESSSPQHLHELAVSTVYYYPADSDVALSVP